MGFQVAHVGDSTAILGRLGPKEQLIAVQLTRAGALIGMFVLEPHRLGRRFLTSLII